MCSLCLSMAWKSLFDGLVLELSPDLPHAGLQMFVYLLVPHIVS